MHCKILKKTVLEEIGDPLAIISKKYLSKIGARAETKVDNGKDYDTEANFVDHLMAEIFFIPIGRLDEVLKASEQALFSCDIALNQPGLADFDGCCHPYRICRQGFHSSLL